MDRSAGPDPRSAAGQADRAAAESGVVIRDLSTLDELRAVHRLYQRLWQPAQGEEPIGLEPLRAMTHVGNYAAGAYRDGELVGACVGFFGDPVGQLLHSHVAGVALPGHGIGYALKLHQRAWALARGLSTITWTFDPLVRRNAYFNLAKLAARPREYLVDFYGELSDAVNAGQGSDRLVAGWELAAPAVVAACAGQPGEASIDSPAGRAPGDPAGPSAGDPVPALTVGPDGGPLPGPLPRPGWRSAGETLVMVPPDIEQLRRCLPATARAWRYAVREVLGGLLADGGRVVGFAPAGGYLVERSDR